MAATMRSLMRLNVKLASNTCLKYNFLNSCRFIYSEESLGLLGYKNACLNFRNQFLNMENTFRTKMQEVCNSESGQIFTEDLKSMLYLAQKKPEDIELLVRMIAKFNSQNKKLRFNIFIIGPLIMRTFYYLDEPDLAFTTFKHFQFENFFNQIISYQIFLSLLYKHGKYTEMRDVFDIIKIKILDFDRYPGNTLILVMAACYKENTPETLEYALNLWNEINAKGFTFQRRASTFLAALAINQDSSHIAIEILTSIKEVRYIDIRCLKVMAFKNLKRFTAIVPIFKKSLDFDKLNVRKEKYFRDVIEKLEESMAKENIPADFELYKLITLLKDNDHILSDTLEDHLVSEITVNPIKRTQRGLNAFQSNVSQRPQSFSRNRLVYCPIFCKYAPKL
ncbi:pentatricopeptide repeat-containing protein 2, mitochondrial-like isoform X1 [Cataglyphis hispanica]|uniref:pentatricopeptide repeat-containing protein 2, mitochondrial-like isoform X1 n=1 Tax=Cataglyphis hispanica TaxID=1086592 RepID=UPI00217F3A64|nr:pentatricopeptide repeat-containing protein 2, mitochondrial-like isoform X1 [Cataglyphis hispanica]XP_050456746.1 pentatricopeptide repeat-containing protein 2, mitochondrial-like isoform X1 [Cataglyphis hispanica]